MLRSMTLREFLQELDANNLTWFRAETHDRSFNDPRSVVTVCDIQAPQTPRSHWHIVGHGTNAILKPTAENTRYHRILNEAAQAADRARFTT